MDPSSTIDSTAVAIVATQYSTVGKPAWSTPVLVIGIAALAIAAIPFFVERGERQRRWLYWSGFLVGTAIIAVALSWRGWGVSLGMVVTGFFIAVITALFYDSSLLKFGSREFSYTLPREARQDEGDPAPSARTSTNLGVVPARNHWWVIAVGSVVIAYGIYLTGWVWQFVLAVGVGIIFAAVSGWMDASDDLPIARGQKVQFAVASVASVMMFAAPLIAYLAAYFGAKKWSAPHGEHDRRRHRDADDAAEPE